MQFTIDLGYQAYAPITLSGKKYALYKVYVLNKQVSKYVVMVFFSNKISTVLLVFTGYGFMLPCMHFMHLAFLDHSTPDQGFNDKTEHGAPKVLHCAKYCQESHTRQ